MRKNFPGPFFLALLLRGIAAFFLKNNGIWYNSYIELYHFFFRNRRSCRTLHITFSLCFSHKHGITIYKNIFLVFCASVWGWMVPFSDKYGIKNLFLSGGFCIQTPALALLFFSSASARPLKGQYLFFVREKFSIYQQKETLLSFPRKKPKIPLLKICLCLILCAYSLMMLRRKLGLLAYDGLMEFPVLAADPGNSSILPPTDPCPTDAETAFIVSVSARAHLWLIPSLAIKPGLRQFISWLPMCPARPA